MENKAHHEPSKLSYQLIRQITNDFDKGRILGSGGFGTVYKGVDENGGEIAVKVLRNISETDDKEFHREFDNLKGLKHPNIVKLVGFCHEWEEELVVFEGKQITAERLRMALCFEYVRNGSLNKFISDESTGLTWHLRYKIIKGMCEGLKYLREVLEYPIMHLDLKPENILLDKNMVPKIADFGLSELLGEGNTTKTLNAVGTMGYIPPEYIKHRIISRAFDIFSLGVIIVKIMVGHHSYISIVEMGLRKSVKLVHASWKKRLSETLSHTSLEVHCNQVKRCIQIALHCLASNRQERPTIQDIVSSLNETETMIGDQGIQNEQYFYQDDGESFPLPSDINNIINHPEPSAEKLFPDVDPRDIPLSLLKDITDDFSQQRLLGRGSYGSIYKAVYQTQDVVVRKLAEGLADKKFKHGIAKLSKLHHQNIVQFIGYSSKTEKVTVEKNGTYKIFDEDIKATFFEYLQNGSLDQYFSGERSELHYWQECYGIIKGICQGVRYLHEQSPKPIIHMDLKPRNILLDKNMTPKISDICMSKLFSDGNNNGITSRTVTGTLRYMPPEFRERQVISEQYDIYSLGVLIMDIITGGEGYGKNEPVGKGHMRRIGGKVYNIWRKRLETTVKDTLVMEGYCKQVQTCLLLADACMQEKIADRPAIGFILQKLKETEKRTPLLDILPLELSFLPSSSSDQPAARNGKGAMISCSLQLSNKGNDGHSVAFMLVANIPRRYLTRKPICGVVPPRCTYTIALTLMKNKRPPSTSDIIGEDFFTLHSVEVGRHEDLRDMEQGNSVAVNQYENLFKQAREKVGDQVREVKLKAIYDQQPTQGQGASPSSSEPPRSAVEIITTPDAQEVWSIDVHTTEPWVMTAGPRKCLRVWNYDTMAAVNSFEIPNEPVLVAKFVPREKWIVAGDANGSIIVNDYELDKEFKSFDAHDTCITCLAVHPKRPFLLSSSSSDGNGNDDGDDDDDHVIKLWDWKKDWKCTPFEGHIKKVTQLVFNPEDSSDTFASSSLDGTVKIWGISSHDLLITLDDEFGQSLLCVDYFTNSNVQHLIMGSEDKFIQIWDLGTEKCVYRVQEDTSAVGLHAELPLLITGSLDGTIHLLSSTTYKLEHIIGFNLGAVYAFRFIKGSRRILVGCHGGIAAMEIPFR